MRSDGENCNSKTELFISSHIRFTDEWHINLFEVFNAKSILLEGQ